MSFLSNFIKSSHPKIEEIIEDQEILYEINQENEVVKEYIINNISSILEYLLIEPDIVSSSKRSLVLPFKSSEIFLLNKSFLSDILLSDTSIYLDRLLNYIKSTKKEVLLSSTLPSYNYKIINKYINSVPEKIISLFIRQPQSETIFYEIIENSLFLSSSTDLLLLLLSSMNEQYEQSNEDAFKIKERIFEKILFLFETSLRSSAKSMLNNENESEIELRLDIVHNLTIMIMKILKVLNFLEKEEKKRGFIIKQIVSDENIRNISHIFSSVKREEYILDRSITFRYTINSLIQFISFFIINSIDIYEFTSKSLEDVLFIFQFDEVSELNILQEIELKEKKGEIDRKAKNNLLIDVNFMSDLVKSVLKRLEKSLKYLYKSVYDESFSSEEDHYKINTQYKANGNDAKIRRYGNIRLYILDIVILEYIFFDTKYVSDISDICEVFKVITKYNQNTFLLSKSYKLFTFVLQINKDNSKESLFLTNPFREILLFFKENCYVKPSNDIDPSQYKSIYDNSSYFIQNYIYFFLILSCLFDFKDEIKVINPQLYTDLLPCQEMVLLYKQTLSFKLCQTIQRLEDLPITLSQDEVYASMINEDKSISQKTIQKAKGVIENLKNSNF